MSGDVSQESKVTPEDKSLHLILFSENSRTFRLEFKRWHLWAAGLALLFMLLTSVAGMILAVQGVSFYNSTVEKTMAYKDAIAHYQIKYEGLYEKAYDEEVARPKVKKKTKSRSAKRIAALPKAAPTDVKKSSTKTPTSELRLSAKTPPAKMSLFPATCEATKIDNNISGLSLSVQVKNEERPEKLEGKIAAVALFKTKDGRSIYIPWPAYLKIDPKNGSVLNLDKANRFVIRSFKNEVIKFAKPINAEGNFEKVVVSLGNTKTKPKNISIAVMK